MNIKYLILQDKDYINYNYTIRANDILVEDATRIDSNYIVCYNYDSDTDGFTAIYGDTSSGKTIPETDATDEMRVYLEHLILKNNISIIITVDDR